MKKIKIFALFATLLVLHGACHSDNDEPVISTTRTVFMYLIADNNISDDLYGNIASVEQGLKAAVGPGTFIVYWDGPASIAEFPVPTLFKYEVDSKGNVSQRVVIKTYNEQNSSDPSVMLDVFQDVQRLAPAESYGLIFGSHATGWLPINLAKSRSLGDDNGAKINIPELANVLARTSIHFDFILMDACLMSQVEVAYELRNAADYLILSPAEVLSKGFPYSDITKYLLDSNNKEASMVNVAKGFLEYYKNSWGTIAVIKSSEMNRLAEITRSVLYTHRASLENVDVAKLQDYARDNMQGSTLDFRDFIDNLTDHNVPHELDEQLGKTIIYKDAVGVSLGVLVLNPERYSGIGCYIPQSGYSNWNNYFKNLQWYSAAGWNEISW